MQKVINFYTKRFKVFANFFISKYFPRSFKKKSCLDARSNTRIHLSREVVVVSLFHCFIVSLIFFFEKIKSILNYDSCVFIIVHFGKKFITINFFVIVFVATVFFVFMFTVFMILDDTLFFTMNWAIIFFIWF